MDVGSLMLLHAIDNDARHRLDAVQWLRDRLPSSIPLPDYYGSTPIGCGDRPLLIWERADRPENATRRLSLTFESPHVVRAERLLLSGVGPVRVDATNYREHRLNLALDLAALADLVSWCLDGGERSDAEPFACPGSVVDAGPAHHRLGGRDRL